MGHAYLAEIAFTWFGLIFELRGKLMNFGNLACAICISTAFLAAPAVAATFKPINTEKDFMKLAVGKKWVSKKGFVAYFNKDHTLSGGFGKKKMTGKWNWEGKYWCRTVILDGKNLGHDCQVHEISGNQLKFTRKKGKGATLIYTTK